MRRGVFALTSALWVASLPASICGCEGQWSFDIPPGDAGLPDARYGTVCAAWATSFCAFQASCADYYVAWDPGQCVARMTIDCELVAADPDVPFDPAKVSACAEPEAGACTQGGGTFCLGAGSAAVGAPCLWGGDCVSGACEVLYGPEGEPSACGTCVEPACGGACPAGEVCDSQVDGGSECVAVAPAGAPCRSPGDCATFYCAADGRCGAPATIGEKCSNDAAGPPCGDPSTYCDPTGQCRAFTFRDYGESCAPEGNQLFQCAGLGTCDLVDDVCIPPAGDGEFCDDTQGLSCLLPALCINHQCSFPSLAVCTGS